MSIHLPVLYYNFVHVLWENNSVADLPSAHAPEGYGSHSVCMCLSIIKVAATYLILNQVPLGSLC